MKNIKENIKYAEKNLFGKDFKFSIEKAINQTKKIEKQREFIVYTSKTSNPKILPADVYFIYSLND